MIQICYNVLENDICKHISFCLQKSYSPNIFIMLHIKLDRIYYNFIIRICVYHCISYKLRIFYKGVYYENNN